MFVLMVAVVPPLLSDAKPSLAKRAGFGDRFHYWRGRSGRRYLFTAVAAATLDDFRFAVILVAEQTRDGRLAAVEALTVSGGGLADHYRRRLAGPRSTTVTLVHLLAGSEAERRGIVDDMSVETLSLAA